MCSTFSNQICKSHSLSTGRPSPFLLTLTSLALVVLSSLSAALSLLLPPSRAPESMVSGCLVSCATPARDLSPLLCFSLSPWLQTATPSLPEILPSLSENASLSIGKCLSLCRNLPALCHSRTPLLPSISPSLVLLSLPMTSLLGISPLSLPRENASLSAGICLPLCRNLLETIFVSLLAAGKCPQSRKKLAIFGILYGGSPKNRAWQSPLT